MNDERGAVVVCVPTYRRAVQLARVLRALQAQRDTAAFDIVIGNNDDQPLASWPELRDPALPAFRELRVATRGVSAVRNAMVEHVSCDPTFRWIACLDDDQVPEPEWLAALLAAGERHDADLVGGPVTRLAPIDSLWSGVATDGSYLPTVSGPTRMLNEAGNLLIATRFVRGLGRPPFSLDFGRTGGEDYEFFLYARTRGARIIWAADARVVEPLPADRLTGRAFAWREYTVAAYQARADLRHRGPGAVLASIVIAAAKVPYDAVRAFRHQPRFASSLGASVRALAGVAGRIAGLAGMRAERYGTDSAVGPTDAARRERAR